MVVQVMDYVSIIIIDYGSTLASCVVRSPNSPNIGAHIIHGQICFASMELLWLLHYYGYYIVMVVMLLVCWGGKYPTLPHYN